MPDNNEKESSTIKGTSRFFPNSSSRVYLIRITHEVEQTNKNKENKLYLSLVMVSLLAAVIFNLTTSIILKLICVNFDYFFVKYLFVRIFYIF